MVFLEELGNVTETQVFKKYFKWTIANFFSFLQTGDNYTEVTSPKFYFQSQQCILVLQIFEDNEWIGIQFLNSPKNYHNRVKLGILTSNAEEYRSFNVQYEDDDPTAYYLYKEKCFLQKHELDNILHSGQITIFCEIQQEDSETDVQIDMFDGK